MNPHEPQLASPEQCLDTAPSVSITLDAFQKLTSYIGLVRSEINGFGVVKRTGNRFFVTDVFLVDQVVSGVSADTDPRALNRLVCEMVKADRDPGELRLQWHSHADMQAFFSGTDIDTIRNYMNDFMISLVMNRRGDYVCRIDIFKPLVLTIEVPLQIVATLDERVIEQCRADIEKHVKNERLILGIPFGSRKPLLNPGATGVLIPAEDLIFENETP